MERSSQNFRNTHKVKIQGIDGENFEVMIDDILSKYNEFYTDKKEENNERISSEDERKYLQAIELMLKILPKNKVLEFVRKDYENKKISVELFNKLQKELEKEERHQQKNNIGTSKETKEENGKLNELMKDKHPITLLYDDDEIEK